MDEKNHPKFHSQFLSKSAQLAIAFIERTLKAQNKVITIIPPHQLQSAIDFSIKQQPCAQDQLLKECQAILQHQYKPYHPHNHNTLIGGFDQYSWAGSLFAGSINGAALTYEISSCFFMMENVVFQHLRQFIRWDQIDATTCPGGSFANFWAIHLARSRLHPNFKKDGIYGCKPMKILTSEVSHYSFFKGAILCGLGTDSIVLIKTDQNGKIIPAQLQKAIQKEISQGNDILLVNSTIGTTVEGSIDPLVQNGQICAKYGIWHHADGAYGGSLIVHKQLTKKFGSFRNVDSITFDPDKGLVMPMNTALFLCKHKGLMISCNSTQGDYVFHKERKSYGSELDEAGLKSLHCSRGIDIVKLWTYLKGNGWENVAKQVQSKHNLALYLKRYIEERPDRFILAIPNVDTFNVCFWYIPKAVRSLTFSNQDDYYKVLSNIAVTAKKLMIDEGKVIVGYAKSKRPFYFWKFTMVNPFNTTNQIDYAIEILQKHCQQAYEQLPKQQPI